MNSNAPEPDVRFTLANERTFLAWNRTALALIASALAVGQFLSDVPQGARLAVAVPMTVLAAAIAVTSHGRWRANQQAIRRDDPLPGSSLPAILAGGLAVVAAITSVVLLVKLIG